MKKNVDIINNLIDHIEKNMNGKIDLNKVSDFSGYSKYHIHRMFTNVIGYPVKTYIRRRKLTEAAGMLIKTDKRIIEIALYAGYETQRSFSEAFKNLYKKTPKRYRGENNFAPIQLRHSFGNIKRDPRGEFIVDVRTEQSHEIKLVGYKANTRFGFLSIGLCWKRLLRKISIIENRSDSRILIGLNDYKLFSIEDKNQPSYDYYATVEVDHFTNTEKKLDKKTLPACSYIVFKLIQKKEDSLQSVMEYIYKEWFLESTYKLNEDAKYDFAKYSEDIDENGNSDIEIWIPVIG